MKKEDVLSGTDFHGQMFKPGHVRERVRNVCISMEGFLITLRQVNPIHSVNAAPRCWLSRSSQRGAVLPTIPISGTF